MAEYSVFFTARSRRDLNSIREWLSQPGSGLKARLKIARITRALAELQFAPERWPASSAPGARQRLVEGHTIIYRIDPAELKVTVVRVFGPFQDRSKI